jgi:hypothetical protein
MKKSLTLCLTVLLVLGLASVSLAGTVYMEGLVNGEYDYGSGPVDLPQIAIGFDMPMDEFKIAGNISAGTIKDYEWNTSSIVLKGGYALIDNDQIRLDIICGLYNQVIDFKDYVPDYYYGDYYDKDTYLCSLIGIDSKFSLNDNMWINVNYGFGISPQVERNFYYDGPATADLDSISLFDCKFNVLFNEEIGMSLGYSYETINWHGSDKDTCSGLTLGVFYQF